jgi:hypothetical protein
MLPERVPLFFDTQQDTSMAGVWQYRNTLAHPGNAQIGTSAHSQQQAVTQCLIATS